MTLGNLITLAVVIGSGFGRVSWLFYDTLLARGWNGFVIESETVSFKDKFARGFKDRAFSFTVCSRIQK